MKRVRIDWIERHSAIVEIEDDEDALTAGQELDHCQTIDTTETVSEVVLKEWQEKPEQDYNPKEDL